MEYSYSFLTSKFWILLSTKNRLFLGSFWGSFLDPRVELFLRSKLDPQGGLLTGSIFGLKNWLKKWLQNAAKNSAKIEAKNAQKCAK